MSSQREDKASGPTSTRPLTRKELKAFTAASRRDEAHRRGDPTPSPEPGRSDSESDTPKLTFPFKTASEKARLKKEHEQIRAWLAANTTGPLKVYTPGDIATNNEQGLPSQSVQQVGVVADSALKSTQEPPHAGGNVKEAGNQLNGKPFQKPAPGGTDEEVLLSRIGYFLIKDARGNLGIRSVKKPSRTAFIIDDYKTRLGFRVVDERAPASSREAPHDHREEPSPWRANCKPSQPRPDELSSQFPPSFPRYRSIQHMNDIGGYLANASYVISLGGPPAADLKYGIIVVPVGEEKLLFGDQPDNVMTRSFLDAVEDANRAPPEPKVMHELDRDSDEFLRLRFTTRVHRPESANSLDKEVPYVVDPARFRGGTASKPRAEGWKPRQGGLTGLAGIDGDMDTGADNPSPNGKQPQQGERTRDTADRSNVLIEPPETAIRDKLDGSDVRPGPSDDILMSDAPPKEAAANSLDVEMLEEEQPKRHQTPPTTRITRASARRMASEAPNAPTSDGKSAVRARSSSSPQRTQRGRPKRATKADASKPQGITKNRAGKPKASPPGKSRPSRAGRGNGK